MAAAATLLPDTQGVHFTARPALRTRDSLRSRSGHTSSIDLQSSSRDLTPNASLSSIEVEAVLRERVRSNSSGIRQAFQTYDVDQNQTVTKGEFRRVLESFCFPLTTEQFEAVLAKVNKSSAGAVQYNDFMDKFYGRISSPSRHGFLSRDMQKFVPPQGAREINMDMIEKMLKEKISQNLKSVIKGLQLYDFNRDGKIQRHELRRVLENYCFKFTDQQYEKLWMRYDFHHTGLVHYKEFLEKLGVNVHQHAKPNTQGAKGAMIWNQSGNAQTNAPPRYVSLKREDATCLQGLSFDQIEAEFRKKMRENYCSLKRIFISFDRNLEGFISIEDLKSILHQFTVPMSDQLFVQLMEICGIKGTGKISWEAFLDKFQSPQMTGNGQTLPIKPSHKFNPIREGMAYVATEDIFKLLYRHVQNHYPSIKQAFLQFDINRKGKVTRKELRKILDKFTFEIGDDQFKELMIRLDPRHTNNISYHQFLDLFEETEGPEAHKWLRSTHRFNENQKPAILAWETIEEILREKIVENWKSVADAIMDCDYKGEGRISPSKLKKIIDIYVLPISDDHFNHMLSSLEDHEDTRANYIEFLEKLDVDVSSGDLLGLSTNIHDGSNKREANRQNDQTVRLRRINQHALERTGKMSADEIIVRLKDRMTQHNVQLRQAFLSYCRNGRNKISKKNFREVLTSFGMLMSDEQFQQLTNKLLFHNGFMTYTDFVGKFDEMPNGGPSKERKRSGNHHVNPIRGDSNGMSVLEIESKLRSKLRENFSNLRAAFYKFDDDHNGILTKENFRRLLDSFMCITSDEEFEHLCQRLGVTGKSRISYQDFLDRFEVRDSEEGHKWLVSCHRYNSTHSPEDLTAEQAHEILKQKVHRQWSDLAKAFITIDGSGRGIITKRELRALLHRFMLPVSVEEFQKLWSTFDDGERGFISHFDFLSKLGAQEFAPGDNKGTSRKIIDQSHRHLEDHSQKQHSKHERMTLHQAQRTSFMTAEQVERQLRDKIRDSSQSYYSAFRKYDTKKKGYLSVQEVQKVLVDLNLFLDDEQFFKLLDNIGLVTNKSRLNYELFLKAFEDGRKSAYGMRQREVQIEELSSLSPHEAESKLRQMVAQQADVLERAFGAFDKHKSSRISSSDFRRVLDVFCFKMTEPQWKYVLNKLNVSGDNCIFYMMFLDHFTMSEQEDSERWLMSLQKSLHDQSPHLMPIDEVQERLRENISAHFTTLVPIFEDFDYGDIGVISKDDFREIITKHVLRLSDEQFEKLWTSLSSAVSDFGNLNYKQFLKYYSEGFSQDLTQLERSVVKRPSSTAPMPRSQTPALQRCVTQANMNTSARYPSRAASRLATPLVNAEAAEQRLRDVINRNWQDIQRQCRRHDHNNTGTINITNFREILTKLRIDVSGDDFYRIMTKYDLKEDGTFCYVDFLRNFVLNLRPKEDPNLLVKKRFHSSKLVPSTGETSSYFFDAMMRLQECVTMNWKDMRRSFRKYDASGSGKISSMDFHQVLRQFNVNMSEDEFFHLMRYDKSMDGSILYNDFLRAYLN